MKTQKNLKSWIVGISAVGALTVSAGVPLNNLQGVGGVAFNPLAYPAGQNADEKSTEGVSQFLSKPQLGAWYVNLGDADVEWATAGVAETFGKRLELSYGYERIGLPGNSNNVNKQDFGAKLLLVPENWGGNKFIPALAIGGIWKTTDYEPLPATVDKSGLDGYIVATKLITELPRPVLLSGGLLYTDEWVTGVIGHDENYDLTWFGNVDVLPFSFLAVGFEYKQGAKFTDFNNANYWDAHVAWFVNKNLTLVAAYTDTGARNSTSSFGLGDGVVFSAQYAF